MEQVLQENKFTSRGLVDATLSLFKGATLKFRAQDVEIEVWLSAWTGLEKIWINGKPVSSRRSFGLNPWHRFENDDHIYEAVMTVETGGAYTATVLRDGEVLCRGMTNALVETKPRSARTVALWALLSGLIGAAVGYLVISTLIKLFT